MHNNIIKEFDKINSVLTEAIDKFIPNSILDGYPELRELPLLDYNQDFGEFNNYIKLLNQARE
jgi:hypothetical protein